jgi:ketosteroid isomerase-like protein
MTHVPALVLLSALAASVACGRSSPSARGGDSGASAAAAGATADSAGGAGVASAVDAGAGDDRALLELEDQWAAAVVKRDSVTFERLLAPGFVYSEDDRTMSRDQVLREIVSGADTVRSAHNEDIRVHHFGPTAVVTGWLVLRGRGAAGAFDRRFRYTDTWARRDGQWQIVAAHDYLVPARRK